MDNRIRSYETTETLGKSQLELTIKVYDGAIGAFAAARNHYEAEELQAGYDQMQRAKRFVTHLYTTLDPEQGGEIAENLSKLYAYVINQSCLAEATKDLKAIDDNITILSNVREGWTALRDQQEVAPVASAAPANTAKLETTA